MMTVLVDKPNREIFVSLFLFSEVSEQPAHADVFGLMGLLGHISNGMASTRR
jgi:hypothetical protein